MKRIKKTIIFLFLFMLLISLPLKKIYADATCADVQESVNELYNIEGNIEQLNCDNANDSQIIKECNNLKSMRSVELEKIFQYYDDKVCTKIDLTSIITKYGDQCSNKFSSDIKEISDKVMRLFFISAPFILLIFGSLDFFKIITVSNPDEIKKNRTNFIKRIIAFLLLYITPYLVRTVFNLTPYSFDKIVYICAETIDVEPKITTNATTSGIYGGYNYSTGTGQAIADAAYEIRDYAVSHGYSWNVSDAYLLPADKVATDEQKTSGMCCATLIRSALYRAGIYTVEETEKLGLNTESAGGAGEALNRAGWEVIWDPDELMPGDVLIYYTKNAGECHTTYIDGKYYYICHIDIYYGEDEKGNKQRISTGNFEDKSIIFSFSSGYGSSMGFLCGLRYPGK